MAARTITPQDTLLPPSSSQLQLLWGPPPLASSLPGGGAAPCCSRSLPSRLPPSPLPLLPAGRGAAASRPFDPVPVRMAPPPPPPGPAPSVWRSARSPESYRTVTPAARHDASSLSLTCHAGDPKRIDGPPKESGLTVGPQPSTALAGGFSVALKSEVPETCYTCYI